MKNRKSWWLLVIVSFGVIIPFVAPPYLLFDLDNSRIAETTASKPFILLFVHILFALFALITGFLQFIDQLRKNKPKIHRYIGRLYVVNVLVSGIFAFVLVYYMEDFSKSVSFLVLTILWLVTTFIGYYKGFKRDFNQHRLWMIRSFGITLVAVSGRLFVPVLLLTYYSLNGFTLPGGRDRMIEEVLNVNIWLGVVLNLVIMEWIILKKIAIGNDLNKTNTIKI